MKRLSLAVICVVLFTTLQAQKIPLINSGEVVESAKAKYDSGKYDESIALYLSIPKRDTNYVAMLGELALSYTGAKKYDEAVKICDELLVKPSTDRLFLLRTRASAIDGKGDFVQAIEAMKAALKEFPFDATLHFNLGITYYKKKEYDNALDSFFKALSYNPYHGGSHFQLGRIAADLGHKTHAMMAIGMYIMINPDDNVRLVFLNGLLGNEYTPEEVPAMEVVNNCERLDQILTARVSADKKFKTTIPFDAPVTRQFDMMYQQLGSLSNTGSDDRWLNQYQEIYTKIKANNQIEPFMYHILKSVNNETVQKWNEKNKKAFTPFYETVNSVLKKSRETIAVPQMFGYSGPVHAEYNDDNRVASLGAKTADKEEGMWYYFNGNQQKSAEGKYAGGQKVGDWKYYHSNGLIKSMENYSTGEVTVFSDEGHQTQHFFLKDDKINGDVELYYECGGTKEKLVFKNGERDGAAQSFYPSGKKNFSYAYVAGKANGPYTQLHDNGQVAAKGEYKDDLYSGAYSSFYRNGQPETVGEYLNGEANGAWKYYYNNGKLKRTGAYVKGLPVGEWQYFEYDGTLQEKRNFDNEGRWHGDNTHYHQGRVYYVQTFKKDVFVKITTYGPDGKVLFTSGNDNGSFSLKNFYPTGSIFSEGDYKKGKVHGKWKYYNLAGSLQSEVTYEDGLAQGDSRTFFDNGKVKTVMHYKDNELHGYYQEFYSTGKVKREGWYQQGKQEQQWISYRQDGTVSSDDYFINGDNHGTGYAFSPEGKVAYTSDYKFGTLLSSDFYNRAGESLTTVRTEGNRKILETKSAGKVLAITEMRCNQLDGKIQRFFPDGTLYYAFNKINGNDDGKYSEFHIDQKPETLGSFDYGDRTGVWKSYSPNDQLNDVGIYKNGQVDSVWTYFYPGGKVMTRSLYKNGNRNGVTTTYGPDGTPLLEKIYFEDDVVSFRIAKADGKFGEWIPFKGNHDIVVNYPGGTKALEEHYKDGVFDGFRRSYFASGKICMERKYTEGDVIGISTSYYPNGNLCKKLNYKLGELDGLQEYYNEDGTLYMTETYSLGDLNGKSSLYKNGKVVKEVTFWAGIPGIN